MIQVELHDRTNTTVKILSGAKNAAYHIVLNQDGTGTFLIHRADPDFTTYNMLLGGIDNYLVHLLRKGPYESAFTERFVFRVEGVIVAVGQQEDAGAWFRVSGRGSLVLLEDRVCFPPGYDGVNQSTVLAQFNTHSAQPGGTIMANEIDRSNPRFALQLTHSKDTLGSGYSAAVLADSPKAYWRLNEVSGNFIDSSGNAHTATPVGAPIYGVNGALYDLDKAISLTGAAYATVVDHADFVTPGTIEGWVNCSSFNAGAPILNRRVGAGNVGGWTLELKDTIGYVSLYINVAGVWYTVWITTPLTPGSWHHIVGTWDGSNLRIYLDGTLSGGPVAQAGTINNPGSPVVQIAHNPYNNVFFNGALDEIAFYSTALSAARVLAHYNAGAGYISQSTVLQTVQLHFNNLHKLHDDLVTNGLDGQMVGLDYQASDHRGTDKSAAVTVAMASQDSLLGVTLERDSSKVANWVVAQGIGEGANALLVSAQSNTSIAALGRREGFLAANQDTDPGQIALRANSAVTQLKGVDQRITTRFVDSPHTQLYRDFDLGDTIKLAVQALNWSQNYRVVGITVTDQDSEVEDCALDLNSIRQEFLLKLATGAQLSADSLNVVTRLPGAVMQVLVNGGTSTVAPGGTITGKASPPLGLDGFGGEVVLTTGTFTLQRPGSVFLFAICTDYILATGTFGAAHSVYFQIDGVDDPTGTGVLPVWQTPGNAETRALSTTLMKVAKLTATTHTVNVIWNSDESANDVIHVANNSLFAFLLGS